MDEVEYGFIAFWILVIVSLTVIWIYFRYTFNYWVRRRIPHIPPRIPKGNMYEWLSSKHFVAIFHETYVKFKDLNILFAGFYWNTNKAIICLDLGLVKDILVDNFLAFHNKGLFYNKIDDPLTGNLFLFDAHEWRTLRSKLTPTFYADKMKQIFPTMLSEAEDFQKTFLDKVTTTTHGILDIDELLRQFSCDIIRNCVFGMNCKSRKKSDTEFSIMVQKFLSRRRYSNIFNSLVNIFPAEARVLRMRAIPKNITAYFINTVEDIIKRREKKNNISKPAYLDILLELQDTLGGEKFTIEQLASHVSVFLMTAYDTCASTLSHAIYELACDPYLQSKLRQDINRILNSCRYKLTYEHVKSMKYLDQVISETLRKYPPFPALFRKCTKYFAPANAPHLYIERDTTVIIPTFSMHYDERYFPNPYKFNPDRFSAANVDKIRPYSYLPFGGGPRECIGKSFGRMHVEIGLIKLINRFKFETCGVTNNPLVHNAKSFHLIPSGVRLKVIKI